MHVHRVTEELYHITQGEGLMHLAGDAFMVRSGDTICIPPKSPHCIENRGSVPLILLCCCSPAYSHDDTFII